jgi:hypothetical protein
VIAWNWTNFGSSSWGSNLGEKVNVCLVVLTPLTREIIFVVDGLNWTNRLTRTAVNALIRVDVKHAVAFIYAVDGTLIDAGLVFNVDARKGNYISHLSSVASAV